MSKTKGPNEEQLSRLWWRFSAYTVSNRPLPTIHPTATAKLLPYDPWEADRAARSEDKRPYKQLLRLAQQADFSATRFDVPRRQRQRLEQWVHHNGLLGILPHETLEYRTAPHWHETPIEEELAAPAKRGVRHLAPFQLQVRRAAGGWRVTYHCVGAEQPLRTARRGEPVDPAFVNRSAVPAATTFRTWPGGELEQQPLGRRFQTFFGGDSLRAVDEREYSSPSKVAFWKDYGEPVGLLLRYGRQLANALAAFEVSPRTEPWQEFNAMGALGQINDAAFAASLAGWLDDAGVVRLEWSATSLLGCFAIMMLQDLAGGQRAMRCPVCGGIFLSSAHQAKFCSTTCRYTHHKREQRRRDAEEGGTP